MSLASSLVAYSNNYVFYKGLDHLIPSTTNITNYRLKQ
uniref:Uncharacterized protein n=1 Tax=Anguilla anguilla TaxID=7936 RepID=A0A0E9VD83_ANGAN